MTRIVSRDPGHLKADKYQLFVMVRQYAVDLRQLKNASLYLIVEALFFMLVCTALITAGSFPHWPKGVWSHVLLLAPGLALCVAGFVMMIATAIGQARRRRAASRVTGICLERLLEIVDNPADVDYAERVIADISVADARRALLVQRGCMRPS